MPIQIRYYMKAPISITKHKCAPSEFPCMPFSLVLTSQTELVTQAPRMILLIGMKTSLIMYPMKPITMKPIAQACRIFMYSIHNKGK